MILLACQPPMHISSLTSVVAPMTGAPAAYPAAYRGGVWCCRMREVVRSRTGG